MCDYSLAVFQNRLAVEGEELVVHRFHTGSKGLAKPSDLLVTPQPSLESSPKGFWGWLKGMIQGSAHCSNVTAVCVPPGAVLLLKNIPQDLQRDWHIADEECVLFTQISAASNAYRDAVHFLNGRQILLQRLREGMLVQVLSLGGIDANGWLDLAEPHFRPVDNFV
jgi:hypothetical protein